MAFLVDDILLGPIKLLAWLAERVREVGEEELGGEGRIQERILELQARRETGEISDEEYGAQEDRLMATLDAIQRRKGEGEEP